jgi:hypothetical protein
MTRATIDLDTLVLREGEHESPSAGLCVMEAAAFIAGEEHSDHPDCVSPVIAAFLRSWNDGLPDDATRTRLLKPYVRRVIGTRTTDADEETRAWLATDWLVRVQTPAWLELAGLKADAAALRALPELTSSEIAIACQSVLDTARANSAAAWAAAWDAAWAAAWDAAWDAAWAAARDAAWAAVRAALRAAAWDAAWAAVRAAAWDAAWDAAWAAARDAAWDALRAAAWDAAWDAAWAAVRAAAWDAAWAAARAAAHNRLQPTVEELQRSACDLLDRMVAVGVRDRAAA